ncbi:MAG TPA: Gfo/Idh/MocA family oxidoreductase [Bacillaceae bacterium]
MKNIRIGMIGSGTISDFHLQAYRKNNQAVIHAICDLNQERAAQKMKQFGAETYYTDYRDLLADSKVDAISICTWNHTHAGIAIEALNAGKHVLVEKPLATSHEDALKAEEAAKRSGKILQVGFVRRFDPNIQKLKTMIALGELGDIYYAKASSLRRLGNPGGWFADSKKSGGGPLIDIGIHIIDTCWYLMGCPEILSISGNTYKKLGQREHIRGLSFYKAADYGHAVNDVEDMANALIRFKNGASLAIDASFTLHAKRDEISMRVYGEKGGAEIEPEFFLVSEKYHTILNMTPQTDSRSLDIDRAFDNEIDHFVDCCIKNIQPISPARHGAEVMKIIGGIYESAKLGREILF